MICWGLSLFVEVIGHYKLTQLLRIVGVHELQFGSCDQSDDCTVKPGGLHNDFVEIKSLDLMKEIFNEFSC